MSALEDLLDRQLQLFGISVYLRELAFAKPRRWRFDFAWPDLKLAVEVEGGLHVNGRHNRADGYAADCEKYNAATLAGWRVLRFTGEMIESGSAVEQIGCAINARVRHGGRSE